MFISKNFQKHGLINHTGVWGVLLLMVSFLASCVDYKDEAAVVSTQVKITAPDVYTEGASLAGYTVTLASSAGTTYTATTNEQGEADFSSIIPDVYTISTSWNLTSSEYAALTGDDVVNDGAVVTGNLNSQLVKGNEVISLPTTLSINRSLAIGKIYFNGSKDNNGRNFSAGSFIEIYNQGDQDIDVSGLYIGLIETVSTPAYTLAQLQEVYKDSVVMCKQVFQIPTTSAKILKPGETVVIVNSAVNYTADASHERDLSGADFEAKDRTGRVRNNPSTPALELIDNSGIAAISYMNLLASGPAGIIIFRTSDVVKDYPKVYAYGKTNGARYLVVPKRYVIDGVDVLNRTANGVDISKKRLNSDVDAGYAALPTTGTYNGWVLYRKTSSRRGTNGHLILQDTNNSSNDFQSSTTIQLRAYDE